MYGIITFIWRYDTCRDTFLQIHILTFMQFALTFFKTLKNTTPSEYWNARIVLMLKVIGMKMSILDPIIHYLLVWLIVAEQRYMMT